jgi:hypothetical protein
MRGIVRFSGSAPWTVDDGFGAEGRFGKVIYFDQVY